VGNAVHKSERINTTGRHDLHLIAAAKTRCTEAHGRHGRKGVDWQGNLCRGRRGQPLDMKWGSQTSTDASPISSPPAVPSLLPPSPPTLHAHTPRTRCPALRVRS